MFLSILIVTFFVALGTAVVVVYLFNKPVTRILARLIPEEISSGWLKYVKFAIYVVGVSGGVRISALERYISPGEHDDIPLVLNAERWTLEIYRALIGALQSISWMLLVFFIFTLIAYVITRGRELKQAGP